MHVICRELHTEKVLKRYLCIALFENSRSETFQDFEELLSEENYILTLDFVLKMLKINERRKCNIPVIIEGETGVGKTALIEMLSKFWNLSWIQGWTSCQKDIEHDVLQSKFDNEIKYR